MINRQFRLDKYRTNYILNELIFQTANFLIYISSSAILLPSFLNNQIDEKQHILSLYSAQSTRF